MPKTGKVIKPLPQLSVDLVGEVRGTNLAAYKESAIAFIESINTDLRTDQDFADAESVIKFCNKAESDLKQIRANAMSQAADINQLFADIDTLRESLRQKRLTLNKLVQARKAEIKAEVIRAARQSLAEHIAELDARLTHVRLPPVNDNFDAAIKGKSTLKSIRAAVENELDNLKVFTSKQAELISRNLDQIRACGKDYLFSDLHDLVTREPESVQAIIAARIEEHGKQVEAEIDTRTNTLHPRPPGPITSTDETTGSFPLTSEQIAGLTDYQRGFYDGLKAYAYSQNGILYVGNNGKSLESSIHEFLAMDGA